MPEGRIPKAKLGKVYCPDLSEPRAAVNRRPTLHDQSLPRLRSEVPPHTKESKNHHINTFIPRYYKQQREKAPKVNRAKPNIAMNDTHKMGIKPSSHQRGPGQSGVSKGPQSLNSTNQTPTLISPTSTQGQQRGMKGTGSSEKSPEVSQKEEGSMDGRLQQPLSTSPPAVGQESPTGKQDPPPPPPPPVQGKISLEDIMIRLNGLAELPAKINDISIDLKQIKVLQEQTNRISQEIVEVQGQVNIIEDKVSKLQDNKTETQGLVNIIEDKVSKLQDNETETQQQLELLAKEILDLKAEVKDLKKESPASTQSDFELLKVKADMLKQNLIVEGIREPQVDSPRSAYYQARSFVKETLGISYAEIDRAYRLGKRRGEHSQPRPLLIRFTRLGDRIDAWEARYKLNSSDNLFIKEDLPIPLRPVQAALMKVAQAARKKSRKYPNVMIRDFKLHINDQSYGVEDLEKLPEDLRPSSISTPGNARVVIFFGRDSRFSNHHTCKFVFQDVTYSSIEQYLADKRATLAGNQQLRDKAFVSNDPRDAKKILNALHGDPSDEEWATQRRDILFDGLLAKFQQNAGLRKYLLSSEQRVLGEASRNKTWGIGLTLSDNGRLDPKNWSGENLLGTTLMEVRERLRENNQPAQPHKGEEARPTPTLNGGETVPEPNT